MFFNEQSINASSREDFLDILPMGKHSAIGLQRFQVFSFCELMFRRADWFIHLQSVHSGQSSLSTICQKN